MAKDKLDKLIEVRCCGFSAAEKIEVRDMCLNYTEHGISACDLFVVNEVATIIEKGRV